VLIPIEPNVRAALAHRSHRILGPNEGTNRPSPWASTFTIFSWRQVTFEHVTSSDGTPFSRMLPRVMGVEFCIEAG
jgi:hypothetical protein